MNRKFFFFDIDGTLAVGTPGRQYIPESTKKAIRMLKEQGHFVAIATGRSYAMAVGHMRSLGFENMVSDGHEKFCREFTLDKFENRMRDILNQNLFSS